MKAPHDSHHEEVPSGTGYRSQRPLRRKPITKKLKTVNAEWKIWRNRAESPTTSSFRANVSNADPMRLRLYALS